MENKFNSKETQIKKQELDRKLQDMRISLMNDEKCKEIARKLTDYISNDKK